MTRVLDELERLDADALEHLGTALRERARQRRQSIDGVRARELFVDVVLSPAWQQSTISDVGRLRGAAQVLRNRRHSAEAIASSLAAIGLEHGLHPLLVAEAIGAGITDADGAS
ncbi:MAG: hypothetical protein ACYCVN_02750 [Acidimicrobiales bacterium]